MPADRTASDHPQGTPASDAEAHLAHPARALDVDALARDLAPFARHQRVGADVAARRKAFARIVAHLEQVAPNRPYRVTVTADGTGIHVRTVLGDLTYHVNAYGVAYEDTYTAAGNRVATRTLGPGAAALPADTAPQRRHPDDRVAATTQPPVPDATSAVRQPAMSRPTSDTATPPGHEAGGSTASDRRAAVDAALDAALERLVTSGEYAEWFWKMSSFRRYSAGNVARILAQNSDATRVASYRIWQQLGRHVIKGERGILILHPKPFWIDPTTGDRVPPPRTDHARARLVRKVSYGTGYVFDISQTEGEPLPELGRPLPEHAPDELADHLAGYCRDHAITVETRQLPRHLRGYYQRDGDLVVINTDAPDGERAAIVAHELSHREDPELARAHQAGDSIYYRHNRGDCEAVAEASAHVISARFGFDITDHSAGYIAGWVDGNVDRFRQLHERVGEVAQQLVPPDQLDIHLIAASSRAADVHVRGGRGR